MRVSFRGEDARSFVLKESYLEKLSKKGSFDPTLYLGEVPALESGEPGTESSKVNGLFFWYLLSAPGDSVLVGLAPKSVESKKCFSPCFT